MLNLNWKELGLFAFTIFSSGVTSYIGMKNQTREAQAIGRTIREEIMKNPEKWNKQ